ncbi:ABC transporter substrate-binding protein [Acidisphaera sp. L21]|uniref:ABC transporter substrate-binding protein n=1 Tax=Acidisphaera sp. L21 TaxID=1641851 RepID=UPI00131E39F2|nr:ABC transporter substrate-binding protein [Acidisphaera sp. L21]
MPIDLNPSRRGLLWTASAVAGLSLSPAWMRDAKAQKSGGTLTVALSNNPITCDPINMSSHDSEILSQTIWGNLVEYAVEGVLRPQLAKALPTISPDKLTYAFELRDDVFFQNGQKLTADDVKYSFEYLINPANKASRGSLFFRISHVEVDSPTKLRVILKEPYAPWLTFLTKFMGIWPKDSREKYGDDYFRLTPIGIGTGPGIFEEWRPNDYVSFKRNPNYWQKGLPHWDRLVVKVVPEDSTRVAYLLSGQADIIGAPPPRDFARLKSRPKMQGGARVTNGGWCVMLQNNAKAPFDDVNFRLAVAHAVDRKTVADKIYYGLIEPSSVPAPTSGWWYDKTAGEMMTYDLDKAKAYMAKSKYQGGAATFELLTTAEAYLLDTNDCAVFLQAELAKVGIKVVLKKGAFATVNPQIFRGDYQSAIVNFMAPGDPTYMLNVSFTPNQFLSKATGYTDPKVGDLLTAAYKLDDTDHANLQPIYSELQQYLTTTSPVTWIGFFDAANVWRDRVKNFKVNQGLTITVRDVWLD